MDRASRVFLVFSAGTGFFNALMFTLQQVYYVQSVGLDPLQLVLVGTVMELMALVFEVPTGVLADTVSRRLSVIVGVFITGAAFLLQGFVPRYEVVLLGSAIWGFGYTFMSGAWQAWIAGETGEENLPALLLRATQLRQIATVAGIVVATGLGAVSLQTPILVGSGCTMLLAAWLWAFMPENGFQPVPRAERTTWRAMGRTFGDGVGIIRHSPVLLVLVITAMFAGGASEGYDRLRDAHVLQLRLPSIGNLGIVAWFGIIQGVGQLLGIVALQVSRHRLARISSRAMPAVLLVLNLLVVGGLSLFASAPNIGVAIGAIWLVMVARLLGGPLYDAWMVRHTEPASRATVFSILGQSDSLGQFVFGPAIGVVGTWRGLRAALSLSALLTSPAAIVYWLLWRRERSVPDVARS